jgi:hypothetical protein
MPDYPRPQDISSIQQKRGQSEFAIELQIYSGPYFESETGAFTADKVGDADRLAASTSRLQARVLWSPISCFLMRIYSALTWQMIVMSAAPGTGRAQVVTPRSA